MGAGEITDKFWKDTLKRPLKEYLSNKLDEHHAPPELKKMIIFALDNAVEYVDFCRKHNKKPDDAKVLYEFLLSKSIFTAKLASDDFKCAIALFDFANNLRRSAPKARGPVPAAVVVSLTLIDLLAVGNSCNFVQEAWYHAFLRTAQPRLVPVAKQVRRTEAAPLLQNPLDPLHARQEPRSGAQCLHERNDMMKEALRLL